MQILDIDRENCLLGTQGLDLRRPKEGAEVELIADATMFRQSELSKARVIVIMVKAINTPSMLEPTTLEERVDHLDVDIEDMDGLDVDLGDHRPVHMMRTREAIEVGK
jgi:hypothetical protein